MNIIEILKVLLSRKLLIIGGSIVAAILTFFVGKMVSTYETEGTLVILPQEAGNQRFLSQPAMGLFYSPQPTFLKESGRSYLTAIKSRAVVTEVMRHLSADKGAAGQSATGTSSGGGFKNFLRVIFYGSLPSAPRTSEQRELQKITNAIKPDLLASSTLIRLRVRDRDPHRAQKIANTTMQVFIDFGESKAKERAADMAELLDGQANDIRQKLNQLRAQEQALKNEYGLLITSDIDTEQTRISAKIQVAKDRVRDDADNVIMNEERLRVIDTLLEKVPEYQRLSFTMERNASLKALEDQLIQLRLELATQQLDFMPKSKRIQQTTRRISQVQAELERQENLMIRQESFNQDKTYASLITERLGITRQMELGPKEIALLKQRIKEWSDEVAKLEAAREQFDQLDQQISVLAQRDAQLVTDAELNRGLQEARFREIEILDHAALPSYPDIRGFPLIVFVILGGGMSFVLLSSLVIYQHHFSGPAEPEADEAVT